MEIRAVRADELDELVDMMCAAYRPESRPRFTKHLHQDSSYALHQSRVCVVDGRIVSYVRVPDRPIQIGKAVVRMGGVGGVSTHPDYRHRGYSTAVLKDAIRYMEEQGYDLSMLFTGIQPFYARLGWVPFPEHTFSIALRGTRTFGDAYGVRAFEVERDIEGVIHVYNEHNRARTGTLVRSEQYWYDEHSRFMGVLPSLVAERKGRIVAYVGGSHREDAAYIREVGYLDGHSEALRTLAHAVLRDAYAKGLKSVEGLLQRNHPMVEILSEESGSPLSHSLSEGMMLRVINVQSLFERIAPELEDRLAQEDRVASLPEVHTSFRMAVMGQVCGVEIEKGKVSVNSSGQGEMDLPLDARSFFKLILGDSSITQLREWLSYRGISLNAEGWDLLRVLFPVQEPIYWGCDHF